MIKKIFYITMFVLALISCAEGTPDFIHITDMSFNVTSIELVEGDTYKLEIIYSPEDATYSSRFIWDSEISEVAGVSDDGTVRAFAAGKTYITATARHQNDMKAVCEVIVHPKFDPYVPVNHIILNESRVVLTEGETFHFIGIISPYEATDKSVIWKTSNEEVLSITSDGDVTALKKGKAIVTGTSVDQQLQAECLVHVLDASGHEPIEFADPNTKFLCLHLYNRNDDSEFSYVEAAYVWDITKIASEAPSYIDADDFPEFQYFISIESIPANCLAGFRSLILPESVISIGENAFAGSRIQSLVLPDSVESIGRYAFHESRLREITIPKGVKKIEQYAFLGSSDLQRVYVLSENPPILDLTDVDYSAGFAHCSDDLKIYVPAASVDVYKNTSGWSTYKDIIVGYDY